MVHDGKVQGGSLRAGLLPFAIAVSLALPAGAQTAQVPTATFPVESSEAGSSTPAATPQSAPSSPPPAVGAATPPSTVEQPGAPHPASALPLPHRGPSREQLLKAHVDAFVARRNLAEGFGYGAAAIAALGLVVAAASPAMDPAVRKAWALGYGSGTAAFGLSLVAGRDTRVDVLEVLIWYDAGVAMLPGVVAPDSRSSAMTWAGASVAYFTEGVLVGINSVARTTKLSALRAAKARLARSGSTEAELGRIEQQLLDADVPFGQLTLATPFGIGAIIAVAPAFDPKSNTNERNVSIVMGSVLAVTGILTALPSDLVPSYRGALWRAGLSLEASPTRVGLTYRF